MKLQQLRYILEVERCDLNVTAAAEAMFTSQPGVSRQIRCLEEELGVRIFDRRHGKNLSSITPAGRQILRHAAKVMDEVRNIKEVAKEFSNPGTGTLSLATTHTQARYKLPPVIRAFKKRYPEVKLRIQQGTPAQIAEMAANSDVDCCIATEAIDLFEELVMLPCYRWNRCILTPCDQAPCMHPLRLVEPLTLKAIAQYPIVTYTFGFTGRSKLDKAFKEAGVTPNVVLTAADSDVIKTYVRQGLGIGIVAKMAYDPKIDTDLCALDAGHLFDCSTTRFGLRRNSILPGYLYDFIELFAPHLTREQVDRAMHARNAQEVEEMFENIPRIC